MKVYLKKEEKEEFLRLWKILSSKFEKFNYKPTEITDQQKDYVNDLVKYLDRRDASTLIMLLHLLNNKKDS